MTEIGEPVREIQIEPAVEPVPVPRRDDEPARDPVEVPLEEPVRAA